VLTTRQSVLPRPRILINALKLHQGPHRLPTGNFQIVLHLAAELGQSDEFDIKYLTDLDSHPVLAEHVPESRLVRTSLRGNSIAAADWTVLTAVRRLRPQIYHRPTGQLPFCPLPCKTISGIADVSFRTLPYPFLRRLYKEASYRWTARMADRIICISQFTHDEVALHFKVPLTRLRVAHLGANPMPSAAPLGGGSPREAYFVVFAHQVHKNAELCLRALGQIRRQHPAATLAVVGKNEFVELTLKPLAMQLGLAGAVEFVGAPSAGQLAGLYDRAVGLLFPSRFEGFGMPVLEAMGRDCPVVCSNAGSLPEVAGDAAVVLDPDDLDGMVSAMARLLTDQGWRASLVQAGRAQVQKFTWRRTAELTEDVYRELLAAP